MGATMSMCGAIRGWYRVMSVAMLLSWPAAAAHATPLFNCNFLPFLTGPNPVSLNLRDLDGDGHLDVLVADQGNPGELSSTLSFLRGGGDGSFLPRVAISTGRRPVSVSVADLDADGLLDLVVSAGFDQTICVH